MVLPSAPSNGRYFRREDRKNRKWRSLIGLCHSLKGIIRAKESEDAKWMQMDAEGVPYEVVTRI